MDPKNTLIYFLTGGVITTLIVTLEESGLRLWAALAAFMPLFTLLSVFFIGHSQGAKALSQHAWLVLLGTLVAWVPYMFTIAVLSPHMSSNKVIALGLLVFFVFATIFLTLVKHYQLFQ